MGTFDLDSEKIREKFVGDIDLDGRDWNVGLIVGASGSGKTTIAKELFGDSYFFTPEYTADNILDDMPKERSLDEITKMFSSVGFASVPSWLKPYSVLSNGEKMRVDLASSLLQGNELTVFDEFTSVIDRTVAKIGSNCVQKAIRRQGKKFIAVSCHDDVVDWLLPDWIFSTDKMEMFWPAKKKDQNCGLKFTRQIDGVGKCLLSTTI